MSISIQISVSGDTLPAVRRDLAGLLQGLSGTSQVAPLPSLMPSISQVADRADQLTDRAIDQIRHDWTPSTPVSDVRTREPEAPQPITAPIVSTGPTPQQSAQELLLGETRARRGAGRKPKVTEVEKAQQHVAAAQENPSVARRLDPVVVDGQTLDELLGTSLTDEPVVSAAPELPHEPVASPSQDDAPGAFDQQVAALDALAEAHAAGKPLPSVPVAEPVVAAPVVAAPVVAAPVVAAPVVAAPVVAAPVIAEPTAATTAEDDEVAAMLAELGGAPAAAVQETYSAHAKAELNKLVAERVMKTWKDPSGNARPPLGHTWLAALVSRSKASSLSGVTEDEMRAALVKADAGLAL